MKAYMRVVGGWGGGAGGTLYPGVECPPLPQVNSDSNDKALLNPFYHYIKMKEYIRVEGGGTLPFNRLSSSTSGKI